MDLGVDEGDNEEVEKKKLDLGNVEGVNEEKLGLSEKIG
jgi:hypothetical protein